MLAAPIPLTSANRFSSVAFQHCVVSYLFVDICRGRQADDGTIAQARWFPVSCSVRAGRSIRRLLEQDRSDEANDGVFRAVLRTVA